MQAKELTTDTSLSSMAIFLVLATFTIFPQEATAFHLNSASCLGTRSCSNRNPPAHSSHIYNLDVEKEGGPLETEKSDSEEEENSKNEGLLRLAELSLEDYKWRSSVFKSEEADRKVEETLARMMGDEAAYVRPMDASEQKIGPLVSFFDPMF
jgi:hypothetical protein